MALRLPKVSVSPAAIVPSLKDLYADMRMQAKVELLQLQQFERTTDITTEPEKKMHTHQVLAAVQLQAAACGLLARRRLQKMRLEMHEAALTAIDLGKWGRDLAPSDGHQRSRQLAAVF